MQSLGMIEVFGFTAALAAIDRGCKAANVTVEAIDNNKPGNADKMPVPLLMIVKFRGSVSDVKMALEAAAEAAKEVSGVNAISQIARADESITKITKKSCIK